MEDSDTRFLILVNPNAGAGMGKLTYEEVIRPMLEKAKIKHDVIVTKYLGHSGQVCAEIASLSKKESTSHDVIISASGDGMLHECLNGLLSSMSKSKGPSQGRR